MKEASTTDIGILKTIWRRDVSGSWIVHDVQSLDLKPRRGFSSNYFKIEPKLDMMTNRPGAIMDNLFSSFGTTDFLVRQSVVPIVAWNEGDRVIKCIGTGFFISASGLLMTAAHVIRDPIDEGYSKLTTSKVGARTYDQSLRYGVIIPGNPAMKNAPFNIPPQAREAKWFMCPFEWTNHWGKEVESPLFHEKAEFKLKLDIAICKVREHPLIGPYQPLNIGPHSLKVGDRAVAIGYAEMENIRFDAGDENQPELLVSVGSVTKLIVDNETEKQNYTPGPNFEFDAKIPGKMSGSPILVGSGILAKGVVSRSWQGENLASGCLVASAMNFPISTGVSLFDAMKSGNEGIARFGNGDI